MSGSFKSILVKSLPFQLLSIFFTKELPSLATSPSFTSLLATLSHFGKLNQSGNQDVQQVERRHLSTRVAIESTKKAILAQPDSEEKIQAAHALIASLTMMSDGRQPTDSALEAFVLQSFKSAMQGSGDRWGVVGQAFVSNGNVFR